jgi:CRP-like cAMP-binding protein
VHIKSWSAREAFGALEVLAARPLGSEAIAATETRTLRLGASALHDLLEDSFGLLTAILHELALRLTALGLPHGAPAANAPVPRLATAPLGLVERMIVLRDHVPFLAGRLEPLAMLAHAAQEVRWPAGTQVRRQRDRAHDAFVVLEGALALERDGAPADVVGQGETVGVLETLGGLHHASSITTTVPTRVLQIPRTTLFDALEEHAELALSVVAMLAGLLLDAPREHDAFRAIEASRSLEWPASAARTIGAN